MRSHRRRIAALALLATLALPIKTVLATDSYAGIYASPYGEPSAGSMIMDLLFARPAGIAATVIGTVAYVLSLPFSIPTGSAELAAERLVYDPAYFTFGRPLGAFDFYTDAYGTWGMSNYRYSGPGLTTEPRQP